MTITKVRVERAYTQKVTDFVEIDVVTDASRTWEAEQLAEKLVKAQIAAGQDVQWQEGTCITNDYPAPQITAEAVSTEDPEFDEVQPPAPSAPQLGEK